jgi:phospholipid-binding lipoprotein MlaA
MKILWPLVLAVTLTGCASGVRNPQDPLEGFNRAMFTFNDTLDKAAVKPVATAYRAAMPSFLQTGIGNFFSNLGDPWIAVNELLQGKPGDSLNDVMRFALNSTLGLAGVLDVARSAGLPKHNEDFGQTLGKWGVGAGPYLVLPVLGPTTLRDSVAMPADYLADPWSYKTPVRWRYAGSLVRAIDHRAAALDGYSLLEDAALDKYEFVRDAFVQRRQSQVDDNKEQKPRSIE